MAKRKQSVTPAVTVSDVTPQTAPVSVSLDEAGQPIVAVPGRITLRQMFPGNADLVSELQSKGFVVRGGRRVSVRLRPLGNGDAEIIALGAITERDPGRSDTFLQTIQDYQTGGSQASKVDLYWKIYRNHGLVNSAINKQAALLSTAGTFKVRAAKKGKQRKAVETLQAIYDAWMKNVNMAAEAAVVTGSRGLKSVNHQAMRYALVEGSWVGRTTWSSYTVEGYGDFDLPMIIQSLTTVQLEPVSELLGTGIELFYWKPPAKLVALLRGSTNPEVKKLVTKFLPKKWVTEINKTGKVLLDPALLLHVKNRGVDSESFGESVIQCALPAIAYSEAVTRLDLVSMQNLVNRLTIVMVGSADKNSAYSDPDVVAARTDLMQSFFEETGPNMTVVWAGDDVKVEDIGAHTAVLDLNDRFTIADNKVKQALGVPEALLSGTTSDGKAAGWAALIGTAAAIEELANQLTGLWTQLGEQIATENGFTDVDVVFEYDRSLLMDRSEERTQNRLDYTSGLMPIRTYLLSTNKDPDAEYLQKCFERGLEPGDQTTWEDAFQAPQGLQGQAAPATPGQPAPPAGPGQGRTPDNQTPPGKTTPDRPKETKKPVENK